MSGKLPGRSDEPAASASGPNDARASDSAQPDRVVDHYPLHRIAFFAFNGALTLANIYTGWPWWAFWPLLVTSMVFGLHYLFYKVRTTDDAWAEERVEELHIRSYDRGHIETIQDRNNNRLPGRRP